MADETGTSGNDEPDEIASLDVPPERSDSNYLTKVDAHSRLARSRTENMIAGVLVWSVVLSLAAMLFFTWLTPSASKDFQALFDRWITLVGPLAGAAVGIGARDRHDRKNGDP